MKKLKILYITDIRYDDIIKNKHELEKLGHHVDIESTLTDINYDIIHSYIIDNNLIINQNISNNVIYSIDDNSGIDSVVEDMIRKSTITLIRSSELFTMLNKYGLNNNTIFYLKDNKIDRILDIYNKLYDVNYENTSSMFSDKMINIYNNTGIITDNLVINDIIDNSTILLPSVDFSYGVRIENLTNIDYKVDCINKANGEVLYSSNLLPNTWMSPTTKKYIDWLIYVKSDNISKIYEFNLDGKNVLIDIKTKLISNLINWLDDIIKFKDKYNCKIYCKLSNNVELIENEYKDFIFIKDDDLKDHIIYTKYILDDSYGIIDKQNIKELSKKILDI